MRLEETIMTMLHSENYTLGARPCFDTKGAPVGLDVPRIILRCTSDAASFLREAAPLLLDLRSLSIGLRDGSVGGDAEPVLLPALGSLASAGLRIRNLRIGGLGRRLQSQRARGADTRPHAEHHAALLGRVGKCRG